MEDTIDKMQSSIDNKKNLKILTDIDAQDQ